MKKQIVIIHGGDAFATYEEYLTFLKSIEVDIKDLFRKNWKQTLAERLGDEYEVIQPQMPCKWNAKYLEWKIWFEKYIPFLQDDVILVGHSLGGSFLAKYLSEEKFTRNIKAVFLVSAVYDGDDEGRTLESFALPEKLNLQTDNIYLYHSKDDHVVPISALENFQKSLPSARARVFEDKGHFSVEEFPELVEEILKQQNANM